MRFVNFTITQPTKTYRALALNYNKSVGFLLLSNNTIRYIQSSGDTDSSFFETLFHQECFGTLVCAVLLKHKIVVLTENNELRLLEYNKTIQKLKITKRVELDKNETNSNSFDVFATTTPEKNSVVIATLEGLVRIVGNNLQINTKDLKFPVLQIKAFEHSLLVLSFSKKENFVLLVKFYIKSFEKTKEIKLSPFSELKYFFLDIFFTKNKEFVFLVLNNTVYCFDSCIVLLFKVNFKKIVKYSAVIQLKNRCFFLLELENEDLKFYEIKENSLVLLQTNSDFDLSKLRNFQFICANENCLLVITNTIKVIFLIEITSEIILTTSNFYENNAEPSEAFSIFSYKESNLILQKAGNISPLFPVQIFLTEKSFENKRPKNVFQLSGNNVMLVYAKDHEVINLTTKQKKESPFPEKTIKNLGFSKLKMLAVCENEVLFRENDTKVLFSINSVFLNSLIITKNGLFEFLVRTSAGKLLLCSETGSFLEVELQNHQNAFLACKEHLMVFSFFKQNYLVAFEHLQALHLCHIIKRETDFVLVSDSIANFPAEICALTFFASDRLAVGLSNGLLVTFEVTDSGKGYFLLNHTLKTVLGNKPVLLNNCGPNRTFVSSDRNYVLQENRQLMRFLVGKESGFKLLEEEVPYSVWTTSQSNKLLVYKERHLYLVHKTNSNILKKVENCKRKLFVRNKVLVEINEEKKLVTLKQFDTSKTLAFVETKEFRPVFIKLFGKYALVVGTKKEESLLVLLEQSRHDFVVKQEKIVDFFIFRLKQIRGEDQRSLAFFLVSTKDFLLVLDVSSSNMVVHPVEISKQIKIAVADSLFWVTKFNCLFFRDRNGWVSFGRMFFENNNFVLEELANFTGSFPSFIFGKIAGKKLSKVIGNSLLVGDCLGNLSLLSKPTAGTTLKFYRNSTGKRVPIVEELFEECKFYTGAPIVRVGSLNKTLYFVCVDGRVGFLEPVYNETAFNQLKKAEKRNEVENYRGYFRGREGVVDGDTLEENKDAMQILSDLKLNALFN